MRPFNRVSSLVVFGSEFSFLLCVAGVAGSIGFCPEHVLLLLLPCWLISSFTASSILAGMISYGNSVMASMLLFMADQLAFFQY